jgi:adenosylcobinamide kinase / adenosylcobinamide-phosphate guanylyltransferase
VECGEPVLYVATATADDAEMAARIARHRAQRPPGWPTLEVPLAVAAEVGRAATRAVQTVLIEDLTLLLSNLFAADEAAAEIRAAREVDDLLRVPQHLVLVSNEVGLGVVPAYPLGRQFRDALGRLNQHAAARCAEAYLLVAGLPLRLK